MRGKGQFLGFFIAFFLCSSIPQISHALEYQHVNARSAILYDMASGKVLYEQDADSLIPPASLTKILTLYLTFEAIESGRISLNDRVRVSRRAASMPKVRMGLRAGDIVTVSQLIRGMAVESGNDAACAMAEYLGGTVENFVARMNLKARELGLTHSRFMTPNGLPAAGQLTTARDILRLSNAYIRRFPEALSISSLRSYTYRGKTDHNPNNLLGCCPGVDGLKTGFVCASGFNISATVIRGHTRMIAVVLGAQNPWIRRTDAETMIEEGYREVGGQYYAVGAYPHMASETDLVAPAEKVCPPRAIRRSGVHAARLAANTRAKHAAAHRARMAKAAHTTRRTKARAKTAPKGQFSRAKKTAAKMAACRKKSTAGRNFAKAAKPGKTVSKSVSSRHKPTRTARIEKKRAQKHHGKKTVRANSSKTPAKRRSACGGKSKALSHKRTRLKTATKKRRHCARNVPKENRHAG